jgi:hypothetical protein
MVLSKPTSAHSLYIYIYMVLSNPISFIWFYPTLHMVLSNPTYGSVQPYKCSLCVTFITCRPEDASFLALRNMLRAQYSIQRCFGLLEEYAARTGHTYAYIILARPDVLYLPPGLPSITEQVHSAASSKPFCQVKSLYSTSLYLYLYNIPASLFHDTSL